MKTEFRKAVLPRELRSLVLFDRKVFSTDAFHRDDWLQYETWWLVLDGVKAGCCAFARDTGFGPLFDLEPAPGCLYIATTGILPRFQGRGLGALMKVWQLAYARQHGYRRVVTNSRRSNAAMIGLNRRFGFRTVAELPGYYFEPDESAVLMEWAAE